MLGNWNCELCDPLDYTDSCNVRYTMMTRQAMVQKRNSLGAVL